MSWFVDAVPRSIIVLLELIIIAVNKRSQLPDFWYFPPFFTLQPVLATREKQLGQWRELILKYRKPGSDRLANVISKRRNETHPPLLAVRGEKDTDLKIKTLVLHDCPLWRNDAIGRELSRADVASVADDFVDRGHGEWEDPGVRTRVRILWRRPDQLASDLYDWAAANGYVNSVCTLYELHSGEDVDGESPSILRVSLAHRSKLPCALTRIIEMTQGCRSRARTRS